MARQEDLILGSVGWSWVCWAQESVRHGVFQSPDRVAVRTTIILEQEGGALPAVVWPKVFSAICVQSSLGGTRVARNENARLSRRTLRSVCERMSARRHIQHIGPNQSLEPTCTLVRFSEFAVHFHDLGCSGARGSSANVRRIAHTSEGNLCCGY